MKHFLRFLLKLTLVLAIAILIARFVFSLPDISDRADSLSIPSNPDTALGQLMADTAEQRPGLSGVIPLQDGNDALASRLMLADVAEASIDLQYYIWHDDTSGMLLMDALYRAAQRGVRVRMLLDDNGVPGLDPHMAALNAQPNFEIRLFNPSTIRTPKMAGYTFDFFRMNRRMHNKSFVVDGAAAIIGGRNVGDEYFQVGEDQFYVDMDALATGAIIPETAKVFDAYWNSASVFEVERIISGAGDLAGFMARVENIKAGDAARAFIDKAQSSAARYAEQAAAIEWTNVQLVADDPVKGQGIASRDQLMISRLTDTLGGVEGRLDLVSAYFVPGRAGTDALSALAQNGRDVRVLTNALNTTDVLLVHAGYIKYRRDLLAAGVELFELKLRGTAPQPQTPIGLSGASLHAKTLAVDGKRVFIGSFNFDPRSAMLNCEMGFLINSPTLASQLHAGFDGPVDLVSYRPALTPEEKMIWQESLPEGDPVIYQEEPGATWFQQIAIVIIGLLPVEWML
ncbi:phospholipase D-like domain-containing protein [Roseovarius sp. 2305UL8-3]|uniref:phospholipase D-like domain-containing protein n=1 Tax=Roseovarius conchicola TaxID=3121636 RepID=UPI00352874D1